MGTAKLIATAAVLASGSVLAAPQCAANYDEFAPNGTYSVVSNGEWASMNDRFQDKPTVRSTWDVTSTCSTLATWLTAVPRSWRTASVIPFMP